jgi:hypothetical protein
VIFRDLVEELHPDTSRRLNDELLKLAGLMNQLNGNRAEIAATSKRAAALAGEVAIQIDSQPYDSAITLRVMRRIASDNQVIAADGERAAEQATMALDVLYRAYQQNTKPPLDAGVRASLDAMLQTVQQNPSAYSAPKFAAQMQKVSDALGH